MLSQRSTRSLRLLHVSALAAQWHNIPMAPPDKILGIAEAFNKDSNPQKINLGVGAYRDNNGSPIIFPSVKEAEKKLYGAETQKEYTGITGSKPFQKLVQEFVFDNNGTDPNGRKLIDDKRIVTAQTISGTGSLRVIADFLKRFYSSEHIVVPNPTWANHVAILKDAGLKPEFYTYYSTAKNDLDFDGLKKSLQSALDGSIALLHACCHNPTGMDLSSSQWTEVLEIMSQKHMFPLVDMAYQGFASGDPNADIGSIRELNKFVAEGKIKSYALCQSFAKNMGLYGERTGSMLIVAPNAENAKEIESQLKKLIRPMYSSPPIHGSRIVEEIFKDTEGLLQSWLDDLKKVVGRLNHVRTELYNKLDKSHNWEHLNKQRGMFVYTGLNKDQMIELREKYSVYATEDGRFSISGINDKNVDYLAKAINEVMAKK